MTEADAYEAIRRDGVVRVGRLDTEWLSTGWNGGRRVADCAYNVSVPDGWDCADLDGYVADRLERAGFDGDGGGDPPVLLTGVEAADARGARCGPVTAVATAGISNPAALPMDPDGASSSSVSGADSTPGTGTVNVVLATTRSLAAGALANLIAVAAEAKAATLLSDTGFPGTTTDAIVVGHDPTGRPADFSGSATPVGAAARACVREAVRASLRAHYEGRNADRPGSVADAAHGVSTDRRAAVFRPPLSSG
ncbi:adenosylcobinamide amidohydrolase [Halopiger djelfimassiliensis]|uniref:adenosylcobinamide amidohydrolase n=1 Tax=Halopiger djelfimassiliensis TaxID=1293047 RepID=UPI0006776172|nr:adenosylcobinamide amidohydrolase [Halopiger djelfimassiliensis]